jgi:methionine synthase II (cobalamin-independent)
MTARPPTGALGTGIGSLPGADAAAYDEGVRVVLGELGGADHGLPHLPELPDRGVTASLTGRGLAVVAELGADLQPAGWRLTGGGADSSGVDHRRARSLLGQDLDALEEQGQGLAGAFKTQVCGPWTLAATVERPRGDKLVADHGARRELAQALAEGVREHVADLRRRLPEADRLVVQVDEPALAAVAGARVPTASGFGRHRAVDRPELSEGLETVLAAVAAAGAEPWVHSCAAGVPWDLVRGAGARGLLGDADLLSAADLDVVATALEAGEVVGLGVLPSTDPAGDPGDEAATERVLRLLEMLGLDPAAVGAGLLVTPACGLAGASPAWARRALRLVRTVAANLG